MNELHVEWISSRFLNLALQQNGFSLVPGVTVENTGEGTLSGLICEVSVTPASFAASRTFPVEELARGGKTALRELKIDPDFDALLSLAEPLDSLGQVSADTVITKQIIGAGNRSGVTINFYSGTTLLGSVSKTNIEVRFCPIIFELLRKCRRIIRYPLDDCLHYSSINGNWRDYEVAV